MTNITDARFDHDKAAKERETLARIAPHLLAAVESPTCARLAREIPTLEETAQTLESVATIARQAAEADPLNRNKLLASLRLAVASNDASTAVSASKSAWASAASAAIEAVLVIPAGS